MSRASTSSSRTWAEGCSRAISGSRAAAVALHGTVTDVVPVLHARPVNRASERIGLLLRRGDARTEADRAQHASSVGEYPAGLAPCGGVKDLAGELCGPFEPLDGITFASALGIARGRHHDAECRARVPLGTRAVEAAIERRLAERREIGLEPHHDGLRLGISQAAIELEHV